MLGNDGRRRLIAFVLESEDAEDQDEIDDFVSGGTRCKVILEPHDVRTEVTCEPVSRPPRLREPCISVENQSPLKIAIDYGRPLWSQLAQAAMQSSRPDCR